MSAHTAEPWPTPDVAAYNWSRELTELKAGCLSLADYQRARICVNYCAGVPEKMLIGRSLDSTLATLDSCMEGYNFVSHQRDELAAVLERIAGFCGDMALAGNEAVAVARAALTKLDGGS